MSFPDQVQGEVRPELERFVESVVWAQPQVGALYPIEHLPDGGAAILFRLLGNGRGTLSFSGPRSKARFKLAPGLPLYVRVRLRAGAAAPFLGAPASTLLDRLIALDEIWGPGARDLAEQLVALSQPERIVERIQDALVDRLRANNVFEPAGARAARRALRLLEGPAREPSTASVEGLSADVGLSERHFRRAFTDTIGMSPKTYARVVRLRRALRAPGDWSHRALASGYYDQAHLVSDFREMLGDYANGVRRLGSPASHAVHAGDRPPSSRRLSDGARWVAEHSDDRELRDTFVAIADDESEHAQLAWAAAAWCDGSLELAEWEGENFRIRRKIGYDGGVELGERCSRR